MADRLKYYRDPCEFVKENYNQLYYIFLYLDKKKQVSPQDLITDFLFKCKRYDFLGKYDKDLASLSTYIFRICTTVLYERSRHKLIENAEYTEIEENTLFTDDCSEKILSKIRLDRFKLYLTKHAKERETRIYDMLETGMTQTDIAKKFNCSPQAIHITIKKLKNLYIKFNKLNFSIIIL